MLRIRLARIGTKHKPFYRIVAIDSRKKRDGKFLANLGTYDAINSTLVTFHEQELQKLVSNGAQMSDSAKKLYKMFKKVGIGVSIKVKSAKNVAKPEAPEVVAKEAAVEKKAK